MLIHILRFEWRYHTRHLTFAAAATLFALMGFLFAATAYGPPDVHVNSPYSVTQSVGLLTLGAVFALTLFCAQSLLRDSEHRMAEIVYTTRVTKARYLFGRFAGSLAAASAAFAFALGGMVAGAVLVSHDPSRLGPIHAFGCAARFSPGARRGRAGAAAGDVASESPSTP